MQGENHFCRKLTGFFQARRKMAGFVAGTCSAAFRWIVFHIKVWGVGTGQVFSLLVIILGFSIRLALRPLKLIETKVKVRQFILKSAAADVRIKNDFLRGSRMTPKLPEIDTLDQTIPVPIILYFAAWKPFVVTAYYLSVITICRSTPTTFERTVQAAVSISFAIFLLISPWLHVWIIDAVIMPLFSTPEDVVGVATPAQYEPLTEGQESHEVSTALPPEVKDTQDNTLYCIPVPVAPYVSTCDLGDVSAINMPPTFTSATGQERIPSMSREGSVELQKSISSSSSSTPSAPEIPGTKPRPLSTSSVRSNTPPPSYATLAPAYTPTIPRQQQVENDAEVDQVVKPSNNSSFSVAERQKAATSNLPPDHAYDSWDEPGNVPASAPAWQSPRNYGQMPPQYGILSPTSQGGTTRGFEPIRVFRSASLNDILSPREIESPQDAVHFLAYAPPTVAIESVFSLAIWAFLVNQREDMREQATAENDRVRQLSREVLLSVRRGALVHVKLEAPDGFVILNDPVQAMTWQGEVTSVKYKIKCLAYAEMGQVLFKATIVVGSKVMVLSSYVFVGKNSDEVEELSYELEVLPATFDEISYSDLTFKELVGHGNFGDAFRAEYKGKEVVVKTLKAQEFGETNEQIVREFRHEAAVLNMFGHHPNIVPFVGACTDLSQPLTLVTEYLPHGSLNQQLKLTKLSVLQKETILKDAAAGVLNIHEGGFIHRDIAARNCLVDTNLRTKICDFGMCRRANSYGGSHVGPGVGPLKYMAPESLVPPHSFSYRSDSYTFGVLMWETFSEATPFSDLSGPEAAALVLEGARLDLKGGAIPSKYEALMARCFADDPSKRPSMAEIHQSLKV
ncbi:unnamed protein product [Aphanomyces euteiches]